MASTPHQLQPTRQPPDVVVLYNSKDRARVERLVRAFQEAGVSVWFDRDLLPGSQFLSAFRDAIETAHAVLVVFGGSGPGQWEDAIEIPAAIQHAVGRRLRIIPTLLEGTVTPPKVPIILQGYVWLNLSEISILQAIERVKMTLPRGVPGATQFVPVSDQRTGLADLVRSSKDRLVISGHTLDRFTGSLAMKAALLDALWRGVRLTVLQLNPFSRHAVAHREYHSRESSSSSVEQYSRALAFFKDVYHGLERDECDRLEVLFTNYMPHFRAVIVDGMVYLYLYMYGSDVSDTPDMVVDSQVHNLGARVIHSTISLVNAPETLPYIRCGQLFERWHECAVSRWDDWPASRRERHRITHAFYVTFAHEFDSRFGGELEPEVCLLLNRVRGRTLVLGCGSGKELRYISDRVQGTDVSGLDFSHVAVEIARQKNPLLAGSVRLWDLYDLELLDGPFDTIVANAAFVHLYEREDLNRILAQCHRLLTIGGQCFVRCLFKEGVANGEELDSRQALLEKWGGPRWFVYYSATELAQRAQAAGFQVDADLITDVARLVWPGDNATARVDPIAKGFPHRYPGVYWSTLWLTR